MIFQESYIYAGKILKTHGYQGHLLIQVEDIAFGHLKEKEPVFLEIDEIYVPFFIESFVWKDNKTAIIKFDNLGSDSDAEEFVSTRIFFPEKNQGKNRIGYDQKKITGFSFQDITSGITGFVVDLYDIPENPVLKIISSSNEEFLVPFNNKLIIEINKKKKQLVMELPEGLF